jgi:hypothetical protein
MIRLFVIYLSYLNIDNLLQIKFAKKFAEKKILKKSANQKQELPVAAMFVNGLGRNEQSL